MGRMSSVSLDTGDRFPDIELSVVSGGTLTLPQNGGNYTAVFFYRGYWWPYCRQQLAEYQNSLAKLREMGVNVIAGSADPLEDARKTVEKLSLEYSLAYGVDVEAISKVVGAYFEVYKEARPLEGSEEKKAEITGEYAETQKKFLQPTGFLIRPDRTVEIACYSSGHIGRLHAQEVYDFVQYLKGKK